MNIIQKHSGIGDNIAGDKVILNIFSFFGIKFIKYLRRGLKRHSLSILGVQKTNIDLERNYNFSNIINSTSNFFLVAGQPGVGKTFFIKTFLENNSDINYIIFRGSEFNVGNINQIFNSYGGFNFIDFEKLLKKNKDTYIIIDSSEQLLDIRDTNILYDFLNSISSFGIKVIFTCREQYIENINILLNMLNYSILPKDIITIDILSEEELISILNQNNINNINDNNLFNLLKVPFYLNLFIEMSMNNNISYNDFRETVLDYKLGSDFEVRKTFELLILERINKLNYYIKGEGIKIEHINVLKEKGVIASDKDKGYFITYDIYEEWGLLKYIDKKYNDEKDIILFFSSLGRTLPMRRVFRLWMKDKLFLSKDSVKDIFEKTIDKTDLETFWKDEVIISILTSIYGKEFLLFWKNSILSDENLFNKILLLTLIAGKVTNKELLVQLSIKEDFFKNSTIFLKADGIIWDNVISFIYDNIEEISLSRNLLSVLKEYTLSNKIGDTAKNVGLISIFYLKKIENNRISHGISAGRNDEVMEILSKCILATVSEIKQDLELLLEEYLTYNLKKEDREISSHYFGVSNIKCDNLSKKPYFILVKTILNDSLEAIQSSLYIPTKLLQIFDYSLYCEDLKSEHGGGIDIGSYFGINEKYEFNYFPASAFQTPFYWLLKNNTENTIDFILEFNNKITKKYIESGLDGDISEISFYIDECEYKQYSSMRLYGLYRGFIPVPGSLSSIHMCLEKFLLEYGKNASSEDLEKLCKKLLINTNSVSITAIIVSIVLAYPEKLINILLILIKTKEIFQYDLQRYICEIQIQFTYGIGKGLNYKADVHHNERLATCDEKHRKIMFEDVVRWIQLTHKETEVENKINLVFDNLFRELGEESDYKFILNRTDLRRLDIKVEKNEDNQTLISFNPKDKKIIEDSSKTLEEVNNNQKYLGLSNYLNNKLRNPNFKTEKYNNFIDLLNEFKLFLDEKKSGRIKNLIYDNLPIYVSYIGIRDYYNNLQDNDKELLKSIIIENGNNLLIISQDRNFHPRIGDELIFYALILLLEHDKGNKIIKTLILEIFVTGNYYYISENIFANKLNYSPKDIFSILKSVDSIFLESIFWGFIFIRFQKRKVELENDKIDGEYTFNLTTKQILKDYDKYIEDLAIGNLIEYKNFVLDNLDKIDDYILVYGFLILKDGDKEYLDIIIKISDKIFKIGFNRDDKIDPNTLRYFLDKYVLYTLTLDNLENIDNLMLPIINNISLETDIMKEILSSFLFKQDLFGEKTYKNFWYIWKDKLFSEIIKLLRKESFYHYKKSLIIYYLFAWEYWSNNAKEWHTLKKENLLFFNEIIKEIGEDKYVLYSISRLLDTVGNKIFFEEGVYWLNDIILKNPDIINSFSNDEAVYRSNLMYYLENYIRKYLFINNQKIRYDIKMKNKILIILDTMVDNGSSTAYLLRDNI